MDTAFTQSWVLHDPTSSVCPEICRRVASRTCLSCIFKNNNFVFPRFVHFTLCILGTPTQYVSTRKSSYFLLVFNSPFPWQHYQNSIAAIVVHYNRQWHDILGFIQSTQRLNWIYLFVLNTKFYTYTTIFSNSQLPYRIMKCFFWVVHVFEM